MSPSKRKLLALEAERRVLRNDYRKVMRLRKPLCTLSFYTLIHVSAKLKEGGWKSPLSVQMSLQDYYALSSRHNEMIAFDVREEPGKLYVHTSYGALNIYPQAYIRSDQGVYFYDTIGNLMIVKFVK